MVFLEYLRAIGMLLVVSLSAIFVGGVMMWVDYEIGKLRRM